MPKRYAIRPVAEMGEANLAKRIERLRRKEGWSYETLATKMTEAGCAISKAAVYSIEQGDPPRRITVNELIALAEIFTAGDVAELLKPVELVEREWAESVAADFISATSTLDDAYAGIVRAGMRLAGISKDAPELAEFVAHRWQSASPGRQWFGEFVGTVDDEQLDSLTTLANAFWEQVLAVIEDHSADGQAS